MCAKIRQVERVVTTNKDTYDKEKAARKVETGFEKPINNEERKDAFQNMMKSIRDMDSNLALGLHAHKTTKDFLLTFQHIGGKSTEIPNKKRRIIEELIVNGYGKIILEELTKFAVALTITNTICIPETRVEGDAPTHRLTSEYQD